MNWRILWNKSIKRRLKKLIFLLPERIKFWLIRRLIRLQPKMSSELTIRLAVNAEEALQAFQLIQDVYQKEGYASPLPGPTPLNAYQLLPQSALIVAVFRGQVFGTLTIVQQNPLGLPLERVFSVKDADSTTAEITCLAIHPKFRRDAGLDLLFPMMKFMYIFARNHLEIRKIYAVSLPRESDFYQALLLFEKVKGLETIEDYLGAPAIAMELELKTVPQRYQEIYQGTTRRRNLHNYFISTDNLSQLHFPQSVKNGSDFWSPHRWPEILKLTNKFKAPSQSATQRAIFDSIMESSSSHSDVGSPVLRRRSNKIN